MRVWRGEDKKKFVNYNVGNFVLERGGKVISHNEIKWGLRHLFRDDGVHLTDEENDIFSA